MRTLKVLLTDGRQFSVQAQKFDFTTNWGGVYIFQSEGNVMCVVSAKQCAAIIDEDVLKDDVRFVGATSLQQGPEGNGKGTPTARISAA